MHAVACLYRDIETGAFGRHVEKKPLVIHLENICAELAQAGRDLTKHARLVGNGEPEGNDMVLAFELAHHDGGENARVDIAAAQNETDALAPESLWLGQH